MKTKRPFESAELLIVLLAPDRFVVTSGEPEDEGNFGELHFFD